MAADFIFRTADLFSGRDDARRILSREADFFHEKSASYFEAIYKKSNDKAFIQSAGGVVLLAQMLREKGIAKKRAVLKRQENGRPFLEGERLDFSISHTDNAVMCALTEWGRIGCDIQADRKYTEERLNRLARFFMSSGQLAEFAVSDDKNAFFYDLWTVKEACLKCSGGTMKTADDRDGICVHKFTEKGCFCAVALLLND